MTHQARFWRRSWVAALLAAAIAAAPLPAMAGDVHQPEPTGPGIAASARKAVETSVARTAAAPRLQDQGGGPRTDLGSKSFFRSPAGVAVLVAIGVGFGYALYSTNNDRVKSPGK